MPDSIRQQLETISDRGLVYPKSGAVAVESIINEKFPAIDVDCLCDCLADSLFDWPAAINEYLRRHPEAEGRNLT